jgi:sec-independent protein translocase protein TatC
MLNFKAHLLELKLKILYLIFSLFTTFLVSYCFSPNLIAVLSYYFFDFVKKGESDFVFNNIFEVFSTYCMLSLYTSCFFNLPLFLLLLFTFFKPGLFKYEKKILFFIFRLFIYLFLFSLFFIYFAVFPCMLFFFLNLDLITNTNFLFIKMEIKLYDFIEFLSKSVFFYCFVIFQIPNILVVLAYLNHYDINFVVNKRKFVFLISLIIGCLLSSPDLLSLLIISLPLFLFFELFLFFLTLRNNYKDTLL